MCCNVNGDGGCVGMREGAFMCTCLSMHAGMCVSMCVYGSGFKKGQRLSASPGVNVIANDKASRRVC